MSDSDHSERDRHLNLTPTEVSRECGMQRREVIAKCMELGVPIFEGRINLGAFKAALAENPAR